MKLDPEDIRKLARFTLESRPDELDCEDWLHMVGEYVEANPRPDELNDDQRRVAEHVEGCASCARELEVLRELLASGD